MRSRTIRFLAIATEIARINALREQAMEEAFAVLESQQASLANMLLQSTGDRRRAVRWMCLHQRVFDGRMAYELLADGDEDSVWDEVSRMVDTAIPSVAIAARMAD